MNGNRKENARCCFSLLVLAFVGTKGQNEQQKAKKVQMEPGLKRAMKVKKEQQRATKSNKRQRRATQSKKRASELEKPKRAKVHQLHFDFYVILCKNLNLFLVRVR